MSVLENLLTQDALRTLIFGVSTLDLETIMTSYIAYLRKDPDSDHGVEFPDLPGRHAARGQGDGSQGVLGLRADEIAQMTAVTQRSA